MFNLKAVLCCFVLIVTSTVWARPQVWNIGFAPNTAQNPTQSQPQVVAPTTAPTTRTTTTTPSPAYYACLAACPTTSEYNPICGSNNVNYHNLARLQCAARCGTNVTMVRGGTCAAL